MIKCAFCGNDIIIEPFVKKEYLSIQVSETYHTQCFVIAHKAQLEAPLDEEINKEVIDNYKRQKNDSPSAIPD